MYKICISIENVTKYAKKVIFYSWYYDTDFYNIDEVGGNILLISIYRFIIRGTFIIINQLSI